MHIVTSLKEAKQSLEELYWDDKNAEIVEYTPKLARPVSGRSWSKKKLYAVCAGHEAHMAEYYLEGGQ